MLTYVPAGWEELVPDDLCIAEPPWDVAGDPVYCELVPGHGGRHYNRELKIHWHGEK